MYKNRNTSKKWLTEAKLLNNKSERTGQPDQTEDIYSREVKQDRQVGKDL